MPMLPGIVAHGKGKAGQFLEEVVFGGISYFWRNGIIKDFEGSVSVVTATLVRDQHLGI